MSLVKIVCWHKPHRRILFRRPL